MNWLDSRIVFCGKRGICSRHSSLAQWRDSFHEASALMNNYSLLYARFECRLYVKVETAASYQQNHYFRGFNATFPEHLFDDSCATSIGVSVVVYVFVCTPYSRLPGFCELLLFLSNNDFLWRDRGWRQFSLLSVWVILHPCVKHRIRKSKILLFQSIAGCFIQPHRLTSRTRYAIPKCRCSHAFGWNVNHLFVLN